MDTENKEQLKAEAIALQSLTTAALDFAIVLTIGANHPIAKERLRALRNAACKYAGCLLFGVGE